MKAECNYDLATKVLSITVLPEHSSEYALVAAFKDSGTKPKLVTNNFGNLESNQIVMELKVGK